MVAEQILQRLEAEFDSPPEQIRAVADLLAAGASPEFVALFRRDETGDPGEERVQAIAERLRFLSELEARKSLLLEQAASRGPGIEELTALLHDSVDQDLLDDYYQSMRPRRRGWWFHARLRPNAMLSRPSWKRCIPYRACIQRE